MCIYIYMDLDHIGTLSSMTDLASKTTNYFVEKDRDQAALERFLQVAIVKDSVSTGEMTFAVE